MDLLSPALGKRLMATGLDLDPTNIVRVTIGELLILPRFGVASVIALGREIEAGIANAAGGARASAAASARPIDTVESEHSPEPPTSRPRVQGPDEVRASDGNTSVVALVHARYGVSVKCAHQRFTDPGWSYQGVCDVTCGDCDPDAPFIIYRTPYETSQGS